MCVKLILNMHSSYDLGKATWEEQKLFCVCKHLGGGVLSINDKLAFFFSFQS